MTIARVALITLAAAVISSSAYAAPLKFNGALLDQIESAPSAVAFRSQDTSKFIETVSIRSIESNGTFNDVSQAFIARAKAESGGAKLLVMDNAKTQEVMVAYLKELSGSKMLYRVERLSTSKGSPAVSVAYSSEFRVRSNRDRQDSKVKKTAIKAIATFDMSTARKLLKQEL